LIYNLCWTFRPTETSKTRLHPEITWPCAVAFYDMTRRADRGDFNGSQRMGKDEGLVQQTGWGTHLPPPSAARDRLMRTDYPIYFGRHNCSSDQDEFDASKIIDLYKGLI